MKKNVPPPFLTMYIVLTSPPYDASRCDASDVRAKTLYQHVCDGSPLLVRHSPQNSQQHRKHTMLSYSVSRKKLR